MSTSFTCVSLWKQHDNSRRSRRGRGTGMFSYKSCLITNKSTVYKSVFNSIYCKILTNLYINKIPAPVPRALNAALLLVFSLQAVWCCSYLKSEERIWLTASCGQQTNLCCKPPDYSDSYTTYAKTQQQYSNTLQLCLHHINNCIMTDCLQNQRGIKIKQNA